MNILGLISPNLSSTIDKMLLYFKRMEDISEEDFQRLMDQEGQRVYEILEGKWADYLLDQYTVDQFRQVQKIGRRNSERIVSLHEDFFHYFIAYIHTTHHVYSNFLKGLTKSKTEAKDMETKDLVPLLRNLSRKF